MNQRAALFAKTWVQGAYVTHTIVDSVFRKQVEWEAVSFVLHEAVSCADVCLVVLFASVWTKSGDESTVLPALRRTKM